MCNTAYISTMAAWLCTNVLLLLLTHTLLYSCDPSENFKRSATIVMIIKCSAATVTI